MLRKYSFDGFDLPYGTGPYRNWNKVYLLQPPCPLINRLPALLPALLSIERDNYQPNGFLTTQ